jgi:CRP-like cAMP-binding protein
MSKHRNSILGSLSAAVLPTISSDLKTVTLRKDTVLLQPGIPADYIYFPTTCVISFLGDTGEGGSIEVWAVGPEGAAGVSSLLGKTKPFRGVVQVAGDALVAKVQTFRRHFHKCAEFHEAMLRYYDYLLVQISYLGICNNRHNIEQRFSRWLLMVHDRTRTPELKFTQDAIAGILGTRRATISVAAAALQNAGIISYTPGFIRIESRRKLERLACQCYSVIKSR